MHLSEGILPLGQAAAWSALAAPAVYWSIRGEQQSDPDTPSTSIAMAGATSLLFAATLLPLPVPVVGATSHICLTPLLALVVGIRRVVWPTFFVLLLQAVFFAHGGITTLGVNTLTLGLLGPAVTVGLWTALRRLGANGALGVALACGVGSLAVYIADAAVLAAALSNVSAPTTTFLTVVLGFSPVQLPLAILEAVASAGIVRLLAKRRPDLLPEPLQFGGSSSLTSAGMVFCLLAIGLSGCGYEGIDGTVFGATAEGAGRPAINPIIDLSTGEVGLAMSIIVLFGLGFTAGRSWERLFGGGDDAITR